MKKIFIFACLLMLSSMLKAQDGATIGVKAGLNLANLSVKDDTTDYSFLPSFYIGALAHLHLNESWAVQPELLFSGQGTKYSIPGDDLKLSLGYIAVPVLLQYMFGNGFRLETGPQLGVLLSANSKVGSGSSTDIKDLYNTIDLSWVFGLGFVTDSGFGVDARYNLGITNINKNDPPTVKNGVIALGLFYQFGGGDH